MVDQKLDIGRHEEQKPMETTDTAEDPANLAKQDSSAEKVKEEQVNEQTSDIALTMGSAKEADTAGKNSPVDNEDWVGTAVLGYLILSRATSPNKIKLFGCTGMQQVDVQERKLSEENTVFLI